VTKSGDTKSRGGDPAMAGWTAGSVGTLKHQDQRRRPISLFQNGGLVDELTLVEARRLKKYLDYAVERVERLRARGGG